MRLIMQFGRQPCFVAFGQSNSGGGITSVDLAAIRDPNTVTLTASDGSAAPVAGADASNAGVMTSADKVRLDGLENATTQDFPTRAAAILANIDAGITHLRTGGYAVPEDGGGALYVRVAVQPPHPLFLQSADGAYWELVPLYGRIDIRQAGAVGDGVTDDHQAFADAIEAFPLNVDTQHRGSLRLIVPEGTFFLGAPLDVHSTVIIEGQGAGAALGGASELLWPADTHGIIVQRYNTFDDTTEVPIDNDTKGGDGAIIRNLKLTGAGNFGSAADGIWLRARATIEQCVISDFPRDGIHIAASGGSGGGTEGNANVWRIINTNSVSNKRHGLYVDGADVNAGTAVSLNAASNGRWGIFDSSFLGNTYIGCHSATNGVANVAGNTGSALVHYNGPENGNQDKRYVANIGASEADLVATVPGTDEGIWMEVGDDGPHPQVPTWLAAQTVGTYFHGGAYRTDNANARNVLVGCYTEIGQGPAQIVTPTMVLGGLQGAQVKGSGFCQDGNRVKLGNMEFVGREDDTVEGLELNIRSFTDSMVYVNVDGDHPSGTQIAAWHDANKTWAFGKHANQAGRIPMEFTTDLTTLTFGRGASPGGGYAFCNRGLFMGLGTSARHITYGPGIPGSGEHARGDIVLNRLPSANGTLGWLCVATGTPGTWEELAVVSKPDWDSLEARVTTLENP